MNWKRFACIVIGTALLAASAMADEAIIDGKTADRVHLREGRSATSASQGLFFTGTRVLCEAEPVGEWVSVTIGAQTGYMKAEYLLRGSMGSASIEQKLGTIRESTFLWQKPEAGAAVLYSVGKDEEIVLLGETHSGWYYVQANGVYGYVPADAIVEGAVPAAEVPFAESTAWAFSSGAGAWATDLVIEPDGTFYGSYTDMDMGDSGVNYANGTMYSCQFNGKFSDPVQIDALRYVMSVEQLTWEKTVGTTWFEDEVRHISTQPAGLDSGDVLTLYQSGAAVSLMTDEEIGWVSSNLDNGFVIIPVLINETQQIGFCQY